MPDIKENIKEELLKMIKQEKNLAEDRRSMDVVCCEDKYDVECELRFLEKLIKFAESI